MFSWTERADGKIDRATIKGIKYYFAPEEYPLRKAELDKAVAGALRSIAYARGGPCPFVDFPKYPLAASV